MSEIGHRPDFALSGPLLALGDHFFSLYGVSAEQGEYRTA